MENFVTRIFDGGWVSKPFCVMQWIIVKIRTDLAEQANASKLFFDQKNTI